MTGFFIAGTGTGVGKTFATCALLSTKKVTGVKPIVSGCDLGDDDSIALVNAMGSSSIEEISPWRFKAPLAPSMAAALEGREVNFNELVDWTRALKPKTLVEGVGGVMVPLTPRHTTRDWMAAVGWPVILVGGTYLGSISHTLTALAALREAKLKLHALILSESCEPAASLEETAVTLRAHAEIPLLVAQRRVSSYHDATAIQGLVSTWK